MTSSGGTKPILSKPKLILVEGKDEELVFGTFVELLNLSNDIEIRPVGGTAKFGHSLKALKKDAGFSRVRSIGIVRDADNSADAALQSIQSALRNAALAEPPRALERTTGLPTITVMILPVGRQQGMLEDICIEAVAEDPAMECVHGYMRCLEERMPRLPALTAKARVRAFLVSREILEDSFFQTVQELLRAQPERFPQTLPPQTAHLFLASRYKPDLDLGVSFKRAQAHPEENYWPLDSSAFDCIRRFIRAL